jgi:DNA polymerase-1
VVNKALLQIYIHCGYVLEAMQKRGPILDWKKHEEISALVDPQLESLRTAFVSLSGKSDFNPGSPLQISWLLFDHFQIPETEGRTTNADVLEPLIPRLANKQQKAAVRLAIQFRALSTIKGTFLLGYAASARINEDELRTIWWLTGAVTGRLRSGGGKDADERRGIVNLQNIHGNQIIQNMLVSDKAWRQSLDFRIEDLLDLRVALKFDYSQIEIRMLAEVSGDPLLIKQFNATPIPGKPWLSDVHCLVGHELIGWDPQKIKEDKDLRVAIKGFHFALVYGVGKEGIYDHMVSESAKFGIKLSVTKKQVEQFYDKYFERYAGVATLMRKLRRQAETKRYVETLFGFRREIRQDDESRSTFWGNQAVNSPIQGTAHNLVLMAMALLHIKPGVYSLLQEPFMEVHDALYFFVKLRDLAEAYRNGLQLLQRDVADYAAEHFNRKLRVPLVAEAAAGFCLGSMPDYQGEPPEKFIASFREKYWKTEKSEDYLKELQPIGRKLSRPV